MLKNPKILAVIFLGLGMLLGYAAASGKLNPFPQTSRVLAAADPGSRQPA